MTKREHLVHIARQNLKLFKSDEELAEWIADLLEQIKEQEL
jgi:hypothetical protein